MSRTRSLLQIADRLEEAHRLRRIAHLKPETAYLAALALRSWCQNPDAHEIARAICMVKGGCPTVCMTCLGRGNVVHRMFNGEKF